MTKAEILKRIENTAKNQNKAIELVNELLKSASMSDDAMVLASILHTMNGCICDTMNNLELILCEMLTEELKEAPEKAPRGKHFSECSNTYPTCLCVTCARDNDDSGDTPCCMQHHKSCICSECSDYVKEG